MNIRRKKYIILLLTITCIMVIGFAVLSSSLTINGQTSFGTNTWNVKFQNIVLESSNNTVVGTESIVSDTSLNYSVSLSKPGDYYSFTVDVVNTGSIDAMINSINMSTLNTEQSKLIDYSVTYSDGLEISQKDKLVKTNGSESIKIYYYYKKNITSSDLPNSTIDLNFYFNLEYTQADDTANDVIHLDDFIAKVKDSSVDNSDVGRVFDIEMGTYGFQRLRVSNVSTPSECSNSQFSQTACGVVMEFVDILEGRSIGGYDNRGGWPATYLRTYINSTIYDQLPQILKDNIIDTRVVSGYGVNSGTGPGGNFVSTDKLYLLDSKELYGTSFSSSYSKAKAYERQLDYYYDIGVTTSNYTPVLKRKRNSSLRSWWLRSCFSDDKFWYISSPDDELFDFTNYADLGVSPAFRIA